LLEVTERQNQHPVLNGLQYQYDEQGIAR